eukprot:4522451-Prymnesium_polylepis.1
MTAEKTAQSSRSPIWMNSPSTAIARCTSWALAHASMRTAHVVGLGRIADCLMKPKTCARGAGT